MTVSCKEPIADILSSLTLTTINQCITSFHNSRYMQLVSVVPTDPSVLSKLGELYDSEQDKSQAFQYHFEVLVSLLTVFPRMLQFSGFPLSV